MTQQSTTDKELEEIAGYHGCFYGDCPHHKELECKKEILKAGWQARTEHMQKLSEDQNTSVAQAGNTYQVELLKSDQENHGKPSHKVLDTYSEAFQKGAHFGISLERVTSEKLNEHLNRQARDYIEIYDERIKARIEIEKLREENERLKSIIEGKLSEDDEFGSEFVIKQILQDENVKLRAALAVAKGLIMEIKNESLTSAMQDTMILKAMSELERLEKR